MTEQNTDVVYSPASITNPGLVHTDRDCPRLQSANRVLEHPASAYPDDIETCDWCAGEDVIADDGPAGPWEDLESMDPDDLVTDGGKEIAPECVDEHGSPTVMTDGGQCRWTGECRSCGKPVSTRTEGTGETEHCVRVRCSECGATNYLTERTDLGPLRADGGTGPWYRCICGARYRNAGAAMVCCTDQATGTQPFEGGEDA